ncbi:hypothetical protein FHG87_006976 [Trinorchestia longiramus]|nr:hypothetical protein FHG87_006976 [Trinorchestia longiramus]
MVVHCIGGTVQQQAAGRVGAANRVSASTTPGGQQAGGSRATGVSAKVSDAVRADMEERGTTPERVEFENSLVEQGSDEEDYLSEEEWTDRNFGASANELDDTNSSDEFCDSEGGSESGDEEEKERPQHPTPHLPKSNKKTSSTGWREGRWQRGYRSTRAEEHESESDLDSDEYSGEYGAEGDESHTATEGEGGADDDDEEDGEELRRQRERRKLEIRHTAPPKHTDTSDTASDTEIASDGSAESDTQIDTDSEFGEDEQKTRSRPQDIPSIIIGEEAQAGPAPGLAAPPTVESSKPPLKTTEHILVAENNGAEKSASLTSLSDLTSSTVVPSSSPVQQLRARLGLHRTESNEALTSERNLLLRRKYLLGQGSSLPKKSVSTADLGNKFKSFMEKISETQKMLHPAPEPSPAMQAYINSSSVKGSPQGLSPLSPSSLLPGEREVVKGETSGVGLQALQQSSVSQIQKDKDDTDQNLKISKIKNDSELDFGELEDSANIPCPHVSATNDSLFIREKENDTIISNNLSAILANAEDVVETVNESLVQRDFQTMAAELGVDNSLHSAKSLPSDVDDLFDQLARDAQDEPASFLSLSAALEGGNSTDLLREKPVEVLHKIEPIQKLTEESHVGKPEELREETNVKSLQINEAKENQPSWKKESPLQSTFTEVCSPVENLRLPSESDSPLLDGPEVKFDIRVAPTATSNLNNLCLPRVASMESLGETDSTASAVLRSVSEALPAVPVVPPPVVEEEDTDVPAVNVKSNMLSEIDALDFMDVNGEEVSEAENSKRTSHPLPYKAQGLVAVASEGVDICKDSPTKTVSSSPSRDVANNNISNERICNLTIDSDSDSLADVEVADALRGNSLASQSKIDISGAAASTHSDENLPAETEISSLVEFPETGSCGSPQETSTPADLAADVISVDMDEEYERNDRKNSFGKESALGSSPVHSKVFDSGYVNKQSRSCSPPSEEAPVYSSTSSSSSDAVKASIPEKEPSNSTSPLGLSLKLNSSTKEASLSSPDLVKNITFQTNVSSSSNTNLTSPDRVKLTVFSGNTSEQKLPSSSNSTSTTPTKRYEGYIPRFKGHISPFSFARDTLDIRKDNRISPSSFGVDKDKATEADRLKSKDKAAAQVTSHDKPLVTGSATAAPTSAVAENGLALQKRDKNAFNAKKKDGDVVQQLVLSRITRKTPEKTNRRNSRPTFSPLNSKEDLLNESKSSLTTTSSVSTSKSSSNVPSVVAATNGIDSPRELNKSTGNLSGNVLLDSSPRYTPKMSQYSPIEARLSNRNRANTAVGSFSRDNKAVSLSNLPATPLTHPHQFENLSSFRPSAHRLDPTSDDPQTDSKEAEDTAPRSTSVPDAPVSAVISGLDLERIEAREKARDLAKTKSDFDLGLSPSHVSVSVMSRLQRNPNTEPINTTESTTTGAHNLQSSQRRNSGKSLTSQDGADELAVLSDRAKEERVRKLLAEQRARDMEAKYKREVRDEKIMEKLKEFRVKKDKQSHSVPDTEASSAPHHENGDKFERRCSRRPSMLELESMQVFVRPQIAVATVVNIDGHGSEEPKFVENEISAPSSLPSNSVSPLEPQSSITAPNTSAVPFFISNTPAVVTPPLSTSTPVTSPSISTPAVPSVTPTSPPPLTPSQISASKAAASQFTKPSSERKSKSKDRERRRSLIQVFAGMFKSSSSGSPDERRPSGGSSPSPSSSTSPPSLTVPKSPATAVRDKLAKLRLPKSKESKSGKKRSSSSEVLDDSIGDLHPQSPDSRLAFSLPTSPAHHAPTPPSATTSSSSSGSRVGHQHPSFALAMPPHASGSRSPSVTRTADLSTTLIEEESLTDDESSGAKPVAHTRSPSFAQPALLSREAELKSRKEELLAELPDKIRMPVGHVRKLAATFEDPSLYWFRPHALRPLTRCHSELHCITEEEEEEENVVRAGKRTFQRSTSLLSPSHARATNLASLGGSGLQSDKCCTVTSVLPPRSLDCRYRKSIHRRGVQRSKSLYCPQNLNAQPVMDDFTDLLTTYRAFVACVRPSSPVLNNCYVDRPKLCETLASSSTLNPTSQKSLHLKKEAIKDVCDGSFNEPTIPPVSTSNRICKKDLRNRKRFSSKPAKASVEKVAQSDITAVVAPSVFNKAGSEYNHKPVLPKIDLRERNRLARNIEAFKSTQEAVFVDRTPSLALNTKHDALIMGSTSPVCSDEVRCRASEMSGLKDCSVLDNSKNRRRQRKLYRGWWPLSCLCSCISAQEHWAV